MPLHQCRLNALAIKLVSIRYGRKPEVRHEPTWNFEARYDPIHRTSHLIARTVVILIHTLVVYAFLTLNQASLDNTLVEQEGI
jgi:hypothetical protein